MTEEEEKKNETSVMLNNHENSIENKNLTRVHKSSYRNSMELEMFHENGELEILRRPSILQKQTTVTSEDIQEYEDMFKNMPLTDETTCGFWFIKGRLLQTFANKKAYVLLYGLLGCVYGASYAYFNATITTLEKRFKIPSQTTGVITVGNDISQAFVSMVLSYYGGKYHRPRCLAFGMYTMVIFCLMTALPHFIWGPGSDSLELTKEYGAIEDLNTTNMIIEQQKRKTLCQPDGSKCEVEAGSLQPQALLFAAQLISGIGGSLYYSLGTSYMDDNIQKSKTPALVSISYFLRMLGPAIGYAMASLCLRIYIAPQLTPTINNSDPRWLGAWWIGWLIIGALIFIFASLIGLFPKTLPRAAVRRAIAAEKNKGKNLPEEKPPCFSDMMKTYKRLLRNHTLVCNNLSSIFYCFGYMPYWIFMPKYIETIYKQSASTASFVTGTVGLVFSALGVLISGFVITKFKPKARYLAAWNVVVGLCSALGMLAYIYLGCEAEDLTLHEARLSGFNMTRDCNSNCNCEYIPYSPVCGETNKTYISPCHAGCRNFYEIPGTKKKVFTDCSCIKSQYNGHHSGADQLTFTTEPPTTRSLLQYATNEPMTYIDQITKSLDKSEDFHQSYGKSFQGPCPVDCTKVFYTFLGVVCMLKFIGATGRASNFLVSVRCVDDKDKPASMGFNITIMSVFAFVPSPIFFGYILDTTCIVWGKTCTGTGNCWLYDGQSLRLLMNLLSIGFVLIGTLFDAGVWYFVKDLKIFDDEEEVKVINTGSGDD